MRFMVLLTSVPPTVDQSFTWMKRKADRYKQEYRYTIFGSVNFPVQETNYLFCSKTNNPVYRSEFSKES